MKLCDLAAIDRLPDAAIVPDATAAKILGVSIWTLRRNDPVPPIKVSQRIAGRRLGDIRKLAQPAA